MKTSHRLLTEKDLPAILALVELALGAGPQARRTEAWWRWKHLDNPFGQSLVLGAFSGKQLVGLRAFQRWELRLGEETWRCARAVDTATHPEFQGQGIFTQLTLEGLQRLNDDGVAMVFNTPNGKSGPGYLKMGWKRVAGLRAAGRPGPPNQLLARLYATVRWRQQGQASVFGLPAADQVNTTQRLDRLARDLGRSSSGELSTAWTRERLRWRFNACPVADYRVLLLSDDIAAIIRLNKRRGLNEGVISLTNPRMSEWSRQLFGTRPMPVDYWVFRPGSVPGSVMRSLSAGLAEVRRPVMQLMYRSVAMSDAQHSIVANPQNWHLQFADLELL